MVDQFQLPEPTRRRTPTVSALARERITQQQTFFDPLARQLLALGRPEVPQVDVGAALAQFGQTAEQLAQRFGQRLGQRGVAGAAVPAGTLAALSAARAALPGQIAQQQFGLGLQGLQAALQQAQAAAQIQQAGLAGLTPGQRRGRRGISRVLGAVGGLAGQIAAPVLAGGLQQALFPQPTFQEQLFRQFGIGPQAPFQGPLQQFE